MLRAALLLMGLPLALSVAWVSDPFPPRAGMFGLSLLTLAAFVLGAGFMSLCGLIRARGRAEPLVPTPVRETLESLAARAIVLDSEGRIVIANTAFAASLGVPAVELIGRSATELGWIRGRGPVVFPWSRALEDQQSHAARLRLRCAVRDRTFLVRATPIRTASETGQGVLVTLTDVTREEQLRRALVRLRRARIETRQSRSAHGRFISRLGEAVRGPANAILDATASNRDPSAALEVAAESAAAVLAVADDLLELTRPDDARAAVRTEFNLRTLLDELLRGLAPRADARRTELVCDVPPSVPEELIGDATAFRNVVASLVNHAVSRTVEGEVVLRVRVEQQTSRRVTFVITVGDSGPAVPTEQLAVAFEPFAWPGREPGETGLELAVSQRLVTRMGGTLQVTAGASGGIEFHFGVTLGVAACPDVSLSMGRFTLPEILPVLVVDDSIAARTAAEHTLAGLALLPTGVSDADAAMAELTRARIADEPYALVFIDAVMPGVDGFTLADKIRQRPGLVGAVVMIGTADADRCRAVGANGYLHKPLAKADVMAVARKVLYPGSASVSPGP